MKFRLIVFVLFFISFNVFSQELHDIDYLNIPLKDVLKDIEKKYNVRFSFKAELIDDESITLKKNNAQLIDILEIVQNQTNLFFNKVSDRYYTITKNKLVDTTDLQKLNEVYIEEYLTAGIDKNEDGSTSVSPDKLAILPGLIEPDILQSLQLLPGVISPEETASGLYIRGSTPDQNLVLWDGIKMYYSGHFFGILSAFNPYVTDKVKLTKNGSRARYGNAVAGVIDITSTPETPKKTNFGFGSNFTHADAYLKMPISDNVGVVISARRSFTDFLETITFNNYSDRVFQDIISYTDENEVDSSVDNNFYFADFTAKIMSDISSKDKLTLSTLYTINDLEYNFEFENDIETSRDKLNIENQGLSLTWNRLWNDNFSLKTEAFFSKFQLNYTGDKTFFGFIELGDKTNNIEEIGLSFEGNIKLNKNHSINSGYQFSSNKVNYRLFSFGELFGEEAFEETLSSNNNTHTLYSEYEYNNDKFNVIAGLRADHYSVTQKKVYMQPRATVRTKLFKGGHAKVAYESKSQPVNQVVEFQSSNLGFGLENQVWALASGDSIPVQRSEQYSAGFEFNRNKWKIDVEGYYRSIEGITTNTRGFRDLSGFYTTGSTETYGIDVLVNKKINNYRTWIAYSFMKNEVTIEDFNFDTFEFDNIRKLPGNYDITHNFSWSHAYNWNNLEVSLGWSIRTGRPYTRLNSITSDENFIFLNFGDTNADRLPVYHKLDFSSTYKFRFSRNSRWRGKVGVSILNLYNRENVLYRRYFIGDPLDDGPTPDYEVIESDFISFGITPNFVFRVEF